MYELIAYCDGLFGYQIHGNSPSSVNKAAAQRQDYKVNVVCGTRATNASWLQCQPSRIESRGGYDGIYE